MLSNRCDIFGCGSFDSSRECQCDPSCGLFENCCADYETECVGATAPVTAAPMAATAAKAASTTTTPAAPTTVTASTPATTVTTTTVAATTTTVTTTTTTTHDTTVTTTTTTPETTVTTTTTTPETTVTTTAVTTATATAPTTTATATTTTVTTPVATTAAPTMPTVASTTSDMGGSTATVPYGESTSVAPTAPTTAGPNVEQTVTAPAPATSELPPMTPAPTRATTTPPPGESGSGAAGAAGASKARQSNCRTYGCGRFWAEHACQCNAKCIRFNNCCVDYSETCTEAGRPGAGGAAPGGPAARAVGAPPPPKPKAANAPARSCKTKTGVEFSDAGGEEIGTVESGDECASVCASLPECTHFAVNASEEYYKICVVKTGKPGRRRKRAGAASGTCGPAPADEATARATGTDEAEEQRHATQSAPPVPPEPLPQVSIDIFRAMKAAAADEQQTLDDDMADLQGDLKYVHTELLTEHLLDPIRQSRKYDIDCIRRQRYVFRNPAALATAVESPLPDFGPFITYDFGVATNTQQLPVLEKYGDFIGIQEGCSGGNCDVRFPAESPYFWFSVGNFCPNLPWGHKGDIDSPNEKCLKYEDGGGFLTGGLCQDGWSSDEAQPSVEPTGERGCIYAYGASQMVSLDELAGITTERCGGGQPCESWADFRQSCADASYKRQFGASGEVRDVDYCVEYDIHPHCEASCETDRCLELLASGRTVELGLPFWRGRCDPRANLRRAERLADLFGIAGAQTEHRLLHQDVLGLQIPCVREGSGRCRPGRRWALLHTLLLRGVPDVLHPRCCEQRGTSHEAVLPVRHL
ncbi:unnamed protein product [Prorocentrum cordatum]|uniref:SMB domain-containing protein n=1 Tax=Prorocentrum cordatum TaxID=2364126 RepID=A0ABN9WM07_9DINO|nr:unnamed protein product [Polarella glacialis]